MVDHFVKDLGIALGECEQMGLSLPGLELANRLYRELQAIGHGQSGTQALVHAINQLST
jgi:3-hydroxyisobutyrate dehydrogenase